MPNISQQRSEAAFIEVTFLINFVSYKYVSYKNISNVQNSTYVYSICKKDLIETHTHYYNGNRGPTDDNNTEYSL